MYKHTVLGIGIQLSSFLFNGGNHEKHTLTIKICALGAPNETLEGVGSRRGATPWIDPSRLPTCLVGDLDLNYFCILPCFLIYDSDMIITFRLCCSLFDLVVQLGHILWNYSSVDRYRSIRLDWIGILYEITILLIVLQSTIHYQMM